MKNLLIIYNVIFLFAGNVLLSNIHHHGHHHSYQHDTNECQECIIIENSNNYVTDFHEVSFSNDNTDIFFSEYFISIQCTAEQTYLSRAPPTS